MRTALVAGAACGAAAGCGSEPPPSGAVRYDRASVESVVRDDLLGRASHLHLDAVTCLDLPARPGEAGGCAVVLAGVAVRYDVHRTATGFTVRPAQPVVDVRSSAAQVRQAVVAGSPSPVDPVVECGPAPVVQGPPGTEVPCTVTTGGPLPRRFVLVVRPDGTVQAEERR